jgi:tetratricopeptide (TPR) repeat protein
MNIKDLLNSAEKLFLNKEYAGALRFYSMILSYEPDNTDAYVGALLSDLGLEYYDEAQVLYYYYESKKETSQNPRVMIEQLVDSFTSQMNQYSDIYELIDADMEFDDGIEYEDFLNLIEQKDNFKEAFEDAIFSTKVIISKKWQFIDFIKKLTENGYYSVALDYLEAHAPMYDNDQDILTLYSLLPKGKV